MREDAVMGGCDVERFWDLTLDETNVYVAVARRRMDFERENTAWLIASVANIAGAKPKVTVDKLLGRKKPAAATVAPDTKQARVENSIAAGMLEAIARPLPPPKDRTKPLTRPGDRMEAPAKPAKEERLSAEQARAAAEKRGALFAHAKVGDAPVPVSAARAKLESFKAQMRALQGDIEERKTKG